VIERPFTQLPEATATIRVDPDASVAPVSARLNQLFDTEQVTVTDGDADQTAEVIASRDGRVVATSSVDTLLRSLLLINSDVYITGSRSVAEATLPDVLAALYHIPFQLQGYPDSDSEKLLLIAVSRCIERRAIEAGAGTFRVGFQQLSRLVDEPGTTEVYEQLAATDVDVHAYGVGDVSVPDRLGVTAHTGDSALHRQGWFVIFEPATAAVEPMALYALARGANSWEGFWTYTPERIAAISDVVTQTAVTRS